MGHDKRHLLGIFFLPISRPEGRERWISNSSVVVGCQLCGRLTTQMDCKLPPTSLSPKNVP
jgi:hypothetical protein